VYFSISKTQDHQVEVTEKRWSNMFLNAFHSSAIGMALVGLDGKWLDVNAALCGILGYTSEELKRLAFHDITVQEDLAKDLALLKKLENGEINSYHLEKRYIHKNESVIWAQLTVASVRDEQGIPESFISQVVDITHAKQSKQLLQRANRALRTRSAVNRQLVHARDEISLLYAVCEIIVEVGGYQMAWVGQALEDAEKTVRPVAWHGSSFDYLSANRVSWSDTELGHGPTGTAIRTGKLQINHSYSVNPRVAPWREKALRHGYQSSIAFPLTDGEKVFGSLSIYSSEMDAFNREEVELLEELAQDLAFGITTLRMRAERNRIAQEHAMQKELLQQNLIDSIGAIANMVEMRDPYTAGHESRVADLAVAIAHELGLDEHRIEGIKLAALIHDVGKIKVPAEILNKPGRLSPLEFSLIKLHPQSGYDILKDIQFPWPIARMVYEHHERLDGSGYPNGLRGDEILLESKIIAVADVVESMQSHRPYRPGLGLNAALAEIIQHRGTWYDEAVSDACLNLLHEGRYQF
jgi:PAS domain S-box-containing protein/putative nucleotidyltransferase with HDIG domain